MVLNEKKSGICSCFQPVTSFTAQLFRLGLWMSLCIKKQKDFKACVVAKSESTFTSLFCTLLKFNLQSEVPRLLQLPSGWGDGKDTTSRLRVLLGTACSEFSLFWNSEHRSLFHLQFPGKSKVTPGIPKSFPQHSSMYFIFPTCTKRNELSQCVYVLAKREIFLVIQLESYRHSVLIPNSHQS